MWNVKDLIKYVSSGSDTMRQYWLKTINRNKDSKLEIGILQHMIHVNGNVMQFISVLSNNLKCKPLKIDRMVIDERVRAVNYR